CGGQDAGRQDWSSSGWRLGLATEAGQSSVDHVFHADMASVRQRPGIRKIEGMPKTPERGWWL
ncbi:MAG: hypothetical protein D6703_02530, partial [Zetaproteobacteria bacterium]